MFVGHYAPALAAAAHPRAPGLGTLFVAAQLVDFAFFGFVLIGVEHMRIVPGLTAMNPMDLYHMPYTHSLLGSAAWGIGFGLLVLALTKSRGAALIAGLVVLSHWLFDLLVHRPDLTLAGAPPKLGFGLWNLPAVAMTLELALIAGALIYYALRTRPVDRTGKVSLALLVLMLFAVQAIDWFGPPPAEATAALPLTALLAYSLAALAAWSAHGHRRKVAALPENAAAL